MIRRRVNLVLWWLTIAYFFVPSIAFLLAGYIRFTSSYFRAAEADPYSYTGLLIVATVVWALVVEHYQLNRAATLFALHTGILATLKATFSTMALVLAVSFFYRPINFSRLFVAVACVLMFALGLVVLHLFRNSMQNRQANGAGHLRIAILGADEYALRVADRLKHNLFIRCDVIRFVALPDQKPAVEASRVISWDHLEEVVDLLHCQEVLVALPPSRFPELQGWMQRVQSLCIPVRVVLDLGDGVFVPDRVFDFCGLPLLDVRSYPVDTIRYVVAKRIFDVAFSSLALLLTAPIMAIVAWAVKLTSRGPVFFAQERVSLNGRRFKMLKFRTMYLRDGESCNARHTARNDDRITPVGRLLRQTSLDELPQFWNVLKSDMSVVGPRPELTFFVQKFRGEIPSYMARHNVKCGITGWAQVNGLRGSDSSILERIEYDLYYLRNWSLLFDIKIICLTLLTAGARKNAY